MFNAAVNHNACAQTAKSYGGGLDDITARCVSSYPEQKATQCMHQRVCAARLLMNAHVP